MAENKNESTNTWVVVVTPGQRQLLALYKYHSHELMQDIRNRTVLVFHDVYELICETQMSNTPQGLVMVGKVSACSRIGLTTSPVQLVVEPTGVVIYFLEDMSPSDQEVYMNLVKQARVAAEGVLKKRSSILTLG